MRFQPQALAQGWLIDSPAGVENVLWAPRIWKLWAGKVMNDSTCS